jgi:hypothetical protein
MCRMKRSISLHERNMKSKQNYSTTICQSKMVVYIYFEDMAYVSLAEPMFYTTSASRRDTWLLPSMISRTPNIANNHDGDGRLFFHEEHTMYALHDYDMPEQSISRGTMMKSYSFNPSLRFLADRLQETNYIPFGVLARKDQDRIAESK